jgi:hypothetical protein
MKLSFEVFKVKNDPPGFMKSERSQRFPSLSLPFLFPYLQGNFRFTVHLEGASENKTEE